MLGVADVPLVGRSESRPWRRRVRYSRRGTLRLMAELEPGTVADWVGGIGSVSAAAIALIVLLWELIRATVRRRADRERDRREQASRVTWWTEAARSTMNNVAREFVDGAEYWTDYNAADRARIVIQNNSADTLYETTLLLPDRFGIAEMDEHGTPSGNQPSDYLLRQIGVLPPGSSYVDIPIPIPPSHTQEFRTRNYAAFNRYVEWIEFRDRNNVIWRRHGDGRLEEMPDREPVTEVLYAY
jgi:hypothetical protein